MKNVAMAPGKTVFSLYLLVAAIFFIANSACQTTEVLTRENNPETLEISREWQRLPDVESERILYAVRHKKHPVTARFHRLSKSYPVDVLPIWITSWAETHWKNVLTLKLPYDQTIAQQPIRRMHVVVAPDGNEMLMDIFYFNVNGRSYYIEQFGDVDTMALTLGSRERLIQGLNIPPESQIQARLPDAESPPPTTNASVTGKSQFHFILPQPEAPQDSRWEIQSQNNGSTVEFRLDELLIHGVARSEKLPFRVRPQRYVDTALEAILAHPRHSVVRQTAVTPHTIDVIISSTKDNIPMTHIYRFIIKNDEAFQWRLSTPTSLYSRNLPIFEAILQSIDTHKP